MGKEFRFKDYYLGVDGRVFYTSSYWGDTTPNSDIFTGGYIFKEYELKNPPQALVCRLKGIENPAIAGFETGDSHTAKEWLNFWNERYAYDLGATKENSEIAHFFCKLIKNNLILDISTPKGFFKGLLRYIISERLLDYEKIVLSKLSSRSKI